ncbi:hypothetical protein [Aurantimonas sp. HBX-1]|uniref:hypothetical protein n=1 Tax=Aurantimonas sp. HBX-1 TaxID=2906072 RepID=UPI001F423D5C|nr:hypothetical protein [Aurantimonas sp. HBX-1]UIJ72368.1 hypothetical protein LXB15_01490 [Aurantimonas sp. HBX-1]
MSSIISAHLTGASAPNPPKQIREAALQVVALSGDSFTWAKTHPEFSKLYEKRSRKLKGRQPVAVEKAALPPASVQRAKSKTPPPGIHAHPEMAALAKERDFILSKIETAQSRIRRLEEELREVDSRLNFARRILQAPTTG